MKHKEIVGLIRATNDVLAIRGLMAGAKRLIKDAMTSKDRTLVNSAIKLGLVDNLGSIRSVARDIVGNENIIDFTTKASFGERLAEKFGAGIGTSFSSTIINKIKNNTVIK